MSKNSGHKIKLQYQQPKENNQNKKKRKCNVIWFNNNTKYKIVNTKKMMQINL